MIGQHPTGLVRDEWDIRYTDGTIEHVTVSPDAGDRVRFDDGDPYLYFFVAERPSASNPDVRLPAEEIFVMRAQVKSIRRRTRTLTPEDVREQEILAHMLKQAR